MWAHLLISTGRLTPHRVFQIILVSSALSDRDQSLFLSTDEGATFQKQLIPFSVETFIFHPRVEDKVLAYTREGKVSRPGAFPSRGARDPHHPLLPWAVWLDATRSSRLCRRTERGR